MDAVGEPGRACRVPVGFIHYLWGVGGVGVTTAFPLDSDLSYAASSRPDFPLLLFCCLFFIGEVDHFWGYGVHRLT